MKGWHPGAQGKAFRRQRLADKEPLCLTNKEGLVRNWSQIKGWKLKPINEGIPQGRGRVYHARSGISVL